MVRLRLRLQRNPLLKCPSHKLAVTANPVSPIVPADSKTRCSNDTHIHTYIYTYIYICMHYAGIAAERMETHTT